MEMSSFESRTIQSQAKLPSQRCQAIRNIWALQDLNQSKTVRDAHYVPLPGCDLQDSNPSRNTLLPLTNLFTEASGRYRI